MASQSFPEHPMQYPHQISASDTLLASRLTLPAHPAVVCAIYRPDPHAAPRPHDPIEHARRSLLARNPASLLDSLLPGVYIGSTSRLYIFKITTADDIPATAATLGTLSFEALIPEDPQSFTPQDLYPCSQPCAALPRACPACAACAGHFSAGYGSGLPLRQSLRRVYSHFVEAARNRMIDGIVNGCISGNPGPTQPRRIFQFRSGVIFGPPPSSVAWGSGWEHNAVGRPFLYAHMQVHLASSHDGFYLLLHPIIVPTPYLPLSSSLPVPPGTPITLVPFGTPAYFLATYTGPTSALTAQFQESLKGHGVGSWPAPASPPPPTLSQTSKQPSTPYQTTPEPSFIIAWIKVENKQGEAKGITIIWPTELCLSYSPSSAGALRPPLEYIPVLPAQLQPSPEMSMHPPPTCSTTTSGVPLSAINTTNTGLAGLTSPTLAQPHPIPFHHLHSNSNSNSHSAFPFQYTPPTTTTTTTLPAHPPRPTLPPSPTTESVRAFRALTLSKSRDIRTIASEVGGYVDAVVRERERERERLKREREGSSSSSNMGGGGGGGGGGGSPRLARSTPVLGAATATANASGSPSLVHASVGVGMTNAGSPQPPPAPPPQLSIMTTPAMTPGAGQAPPQGQQGQGPATTAIATTTTEDGAVYPILPSIPGVVAPPAPRLPTPAPAPVQAAVPATPVVTHTQVQNQNQSTSSPVVGGAHHPPGAQVQQPQMQSQGQNQSQAQAQAQAQAQGQAQVQTNQAHVQAQMFYPSPPHTNPVPSGSGSGVPIPMAVGEGEGAGAGAARVSAQGGQGDASAAVPTTGAGGQQDRQAEQPMPTPAATAPAPSSAAPSVSGPTTTTTTTTGDNTTKSTPSASASAYDLFGWVGQSGLDMGMGMDMNLGMGMGMGMDMGMNMGMEMGMDVDMDFNFDMSFGGFGSGSGGGSGGSGGGEAGGGGDAAGSSSNTGNINSSSGSGFGNLGLGRPGPGPPGAGTLGVGGGTARVASNGSTHGAGAGTGQNRGLGMGAGGGSGMSMGDFDDFTDDDFSFFDKPSTTGGGAIGIGVTSMAGASASGGVGVITPSTSLPGGLGSSNAQASSSLMSPVTSTTPGPTGLYAPLTASMTHGPSTTTAALPTLASVSIPPTLALGPGPIMSPILATTAVPVPVPMSATSPSSLFDGNGNGQPTPGPGPMSPVVSMLGQAGSPWSVGVSLSGQGQGLQGQGPEMMFPSPPNDTPGRASHAHPHSVPATPQVHADAEQNQTRMVESMSHSPGVPGTGPGAGGIFDPIPFDPRHRAADDKYSFGKFAFALPSPDPTETGWDGDEGGEGVGSVGQGKGRKGTSGGKKHRKLKGGQVGESRDGGGASDEVGMGEGEEREGKLLPPFRMKDLSPGNEAVVMVNNGIIGTAGAKGWKYRYDAATDPRIGVVKKLIGVKRKRAACSGGCDKRLKDAAGCKMKSGANVPSWLKLDRYRGQGYGYGCDEDSEDEDGYGYGWGDDRKATLAKKRHLASSQRKLGHRRKRSKHKAGVYNSTTAFSSDSESSLSPSTDGDDSDSYSDTDSNVSMDLQNDYSDSATTPSNPLGTPEDLDVRPSTPPPSYLPLGPTLIQTYFHHLLLLPLSSPLRPPLAPIPPSSTTTTQGQGHQQISVPTPVSPAAMVGAASEKSKIKEEVAQTVAREAVENWVWGEAWWTNNYHHFGYDVTNGTGDVGCSNSCGGCGGLWYMGAGGAGLKRGMMEVWMSDVKAVVKMLKRVDGLEVPMSLGRLFGIGDPQNAGTLASVSDLSSRQALPLTQAASPGEALLSFEPPMITVSKNDAIIRVLPSALRFWEKIGLGPRAGKKNVEAYVLFEEDGSGEEKYDKVECWLTNVAAVYQDKHYGDHVAGRSTYCPRPGLVPLRFDSSFKKSFPSFLSSLPNTDSTLIFYILTPSSTMSLSSTTLRTTLLTLKKVLKNTITPNADPPHYVNFDRYPLPLSQFVPDHHIFCSFENPAIHNSIISTLCDSTYNRILVPVDRYMSRPMLHSPDHTNAPPSTPTGAAPSSTSTSTSTIIPLSLRRYFEEPSITLARPIYSNISYVKASDRMRGATLDVADRYMFCHIAYGISGDGRWLVASVVDQRGEGHDLNVWMIPSSCYGYCGAGSGGSGGDTAHGNSSAEGEEVEVSLETFIIGKIWAFAVRFASRANIEWRIIFTRLGVIPEREAIAWKNYLEHAIRMGRDMVPMHASLVCAEMKTPWTFMTSTPTIPLSSTRTPIKSNSAASLSTLLPSSSSPYLASRAPPTYPPSPYGPVSSSAPSSSTNGSKHNSNHHHPLSSSQAVFTDISSITYALFSKMRAPISVPPTMGDLGLTMAYIPEYSSGQSHLHQSTNSNQHLNSSTPATPSGGVDSAHHTPSMISHPTPSPFADPSNEDHYDLPQPVTLLPASTTILVRVPNNTPSPVSIQMLHVHLIFESWHSPRTAWWVKSKEKAKQRESRRERLGQGLGNAQSDENMNVDGNEQTDEDYDEILRRDLARNWYELSVLSKERWSLSLFDSGNDVGILPFHLAAVEIMKSILERDGGRKGGDGPSDG